MTKAFCIITLFITTSIKMAGQCPADHFPGTHLTNQIKDGSICWMRIIDPNNISNIFHTKYEFVRNGSDGNCVLDFYYDKISDTIGVKYSNNGIVIRRKITIDPLGSQLIFKDYHANEKVENNEFCSILFTVHNANLPYVSLNQFALLDNDEVIYKLDDVSDYDLANHNATVAAYLSKFPSQPVADKTQETHNTNIENFLKRMDQYRDSVKSQKQEPSSNVVLPADAKEEMQQVFKRQLDSLFINCYKTVFPYADYKTEYKFTFIATEGKILNYTDMYSYNSLPIQWFEDSFKNQILPNIAKINFPVKTLLTGNANLESDFKTKFQEAFMKLDPNEDEQGRYKVMENSVLGDLRLYGPSEISIPTKYYYTVKYRSTVNSEVWVKKSDDNGTSIYLKDSKEEVSDDLKTQFVLKKIMKKKSTYNIKRCDVFINDQGFRDIMEE